jgi:hypothetical protein
LSGFNEKRRFDSGATRDGPPARKGILANPAAFFAATLATILFLATALMVIGAAAAGQEYLGQLISSTQVVAVLKPSATSEQIDGIRERVGALAGVDEARVVTFDAFTKALPSGVDIGMKQAPVVLRVRASQNVTGLRGWSDAVRRELSVSPLTESVRVDGDWIDRADLWTARLDVSRVWLRVACCIFVGLGVGATWYLGVRVLRPNTFGAGAYTVLTGVVLAMAFCGAAVMAGYGLGIPVPAEQLWVQTRLSIACLAGAMLAAGLLANGLARR